MSLFLALSDTIPTATSRYYYGQASERCFEK